MKYALWIGAFVVIISSTSIYMYKVQPDQEQLTSSQRVLYAVFPPSDLYSDVAVFGVSNQKQEYYFRTTFNYPGRHSYGFYVDSLPRGMIKPEGGYLASSELHGTLYLRGERGEREYPILGGLLSVFGGVEKGFIAGKIDVGKDFPTGMEVEAKLVLDVFDSSSTMKYGSFRFYIAKESLAMDWR